MASAAITVANAMRPALAGEAVAVSPAGYETICDTNGAAMTARSRLSRVRASLGTTKEDGTDAEQRADARQVYEEEIQAASVAAGQERDVGAIWQDVRDHWDPPSAKLKETSPAKKADENRPEEPEGVAPTAEGGAAAASSAAASANAARAPSPAVGIFFDKVLGEDYIWASWGNDPPEPWTART